MAAANTKSGRTQKKYTFPYFCFEWLAHMKYIVGKIDRGIHKKIKIMVNPKGVDKFGLSKTIMLQNAIPKRTGSNKR